MNLGVTEYRISFFLVLSQKLVGSLCDPELYNP